MKFKVSISSQCDGKFTVHFNQTGFHCESEKEAIQMVRNWIEVLESSVESAIETYYMNKKED